MKSIGAAVWRLQDQPDFGYNVRSEHGRLNSLSSESELLTVLAILNWRNMWKRQAKAGCHSPHGSSTTSRLEPFAESRPWLENAPGPHLIGVGTMLAFVGFKAAVGACVGRNRY